jgi:hypothetical protein
MLERIRQAWRSLAQTQDDARKAKTAVRRYTDSLAWMLGDMRLDPAEIEGLRGQITAGALTPEKVRLVHQEVFTGFVRHVFADGIVAAEELDAVARVPIGLGLAGC